MFPAQAGINRGFTFRGRTKENVPRASGDKPRNVLTELMKARGLATVFHTDLDALNAERVRIQTDDQ